MTLRASSEATSKEGVPTGFIRNGCGVSVRHAGREGFDQLCQKERIEHWARTLMYRTHNRLSGHYSQEEYPRVQLEALSSATAQSSDDYSLLLVFKKKHLPSPLGG